MLYMVVYAASSNAKSSAQRAYFYRRNKRKSRGASATSNTKNTTATRGVPATKKSP